jgi:predicted permease
MQLFNLDPVQVGIFLVGLVVAWMIVRLVKARFAPSPRRAAGAGVGAAWFPAAIALALLLAAWVYLFQG